jgi:hypothetical protein
MSGLFDQQTFGGGGLNLWLGQVVDDSTWRDNINPKLRQDKDDVKGFGYRYKVRIFGNQTKNKTDEVSDEELPMCEVLYPVTAGSGLGGSRMTPNIRQGNFVMGFYKDGLDRQQPVILGCLGTNDNTELYGGDPQEGFVPRTGMAGLSGQVPVADKDQSLSPGSMPIREGTGANVASVGDVKQALSGNESTALANADKKSSSEMDSMQVVIKNLLAVVNKIKSAQSSFFGAATAPTKILQAELNKSASMIAGFMKSLISKIRGAVVTALNNLVKDTVDLLMPNERPKLNEAQNKGTDTLACVINKIIDGLLKLLTAFLKELINKYVNAPMCAIESMVGKIIDKALGQVSNALDSIFGPINSILSGITGAIGGALGSISGLIDQIAGVLQFLSCDPGGSIPEIKEWSPWGGINIQDPLSGPLGSILEQAGNSLGLDGSVPPCNTGPAQAGPPSIYIIGGNPLVPAEINPIIQPPPSGATPPGGGGGPGGGIIGGDIVNPGSGYQGTPTVIVGNTPGNGNTGGGAVLQPIVENGQITGIVVADPGTGYSTGSNGTTTGPNGAIFSNPGDTIVNTPYPGPIIPGGTNLEQPYTVPAGTTIPTGTVISSGTQLVTDTIVDGNTLPSGTILSNNLIVPFGTTIPTGSIISNLNATPYDIQVPSVLDLPQQIIDDLPDPGFSNSLEPGDGTGLLVAGYNSYPDGTLVFVTPGTQISLPLGTTAELTDKNGNVLQVLVGKGPNSPITVKVAGFFTTPKTDLNTITVDNPTDNFGRYPVALGIKDIIIANRGINYQPGDEIVIQPNFGAKLKPRFDSFGRLMDVEVLDEGIGFTEIPNVYIKSTTGINAKMRVLFRVRRIGEDIAEGTVVPEGTPIIRVVDCVGQVT